MYIRKNTGTVMNVYSVRSGFIVSITMNTAMSCTVFVMRKGRPSTKNQYIVVASLLICVMSPPVWRLEKNFIDSLPMVLKMVFFRS